MPSPIETLQSEVARLVHLVYGGRVVAVRVRIDLSDGGALDARVPLPLVSGPGPPECPYQGTPACPLGARHKEPFTPNDMQAAVLEALEEGPLTADRLAERAGYARQTLYRHPGGIRELIEQRLVRKGKEGYELDGGPVT